MPSTPSAADEIHFARTRDGWRLALHRHRARGAGTAPPVILCGGYGCNRHFMDYDERHSLARFLARHAFDTWVVELRGRGLSHPTRACARPGAWTFDDLATIDVPAAVAYVAEVTGRRVSWVGHSMGGMVLYACLGTHPGMATMVEAGVTIASPLAFAPVSSTLLNRIGHFLLGLPFSDTVPQRWVLGALWHLVGQSDLVAMGMNPANVDHALVGRALRLALSNVSRLKLQQLARWALEGEFSSMDRRVDYRAALADVATPLLTIAGSADRLAAPGLVSRALDYLPRGASRFVEFGRAHGQRVDYGHVDLILGRGAPDEVFPAVAGWLREHRRGG